LATILSKQFQGVLDHEKSIATIFMLGSMVLASTAFAQSRTHTFRGTLFNGRLDVPVSYATSFPRHPRIQGTLWNGIIDVPFLPASVSGTIYSTLGNGYIDLPLPSGRVRGTLGNHVLDLPLPAF